MALRQGNHMNPKGAPGEYSQNISKCKWLAFDVEPIMLVVWRLEKPREFKIKCPILSVTEEFWTTSLGFKRWYVSSIYNW